MKYVKILISGYIVLMFSLLSSCTIFSPVTLVPETTYVLSQIPPVPVKKPIRSITLLVTQPETSPVYSTSQIAYTAQPYQIAYFGKNRWAEPPAVMLQQLIVQTLQNTRHFYAVVSPPFVGRYDYILSTQLVELRQDFIHHPTVVHLTFRAHLIRISDNRIIATRQFSVVQRTYQNTPYSGVIAANRAVGTLLAQLTSFCLKALP